MSEVVRVTIHQSKGLTVRLKGEKEFSEVAASEVIEFIRSAEFQLFAAMLILSAAPGDLGIKVV